MIDQYPPANGVLTSLIWRKTATGGETSLSGYDNASQALSYTPGQEQVYLNGILLVRGSDYTATNGTSITGLTALAADDFVQVNCYNNFSVASVPAASITGTVTNAQLANSSITINGSAVSLGGSVSLPGDIESVTASSPLTGGGSTGALTIGIQSASTSQAGAVQLSDSTSTTSSILAATPTAVKSAYDLANSAIAKSLIDAKGDLIVGSANDTAARLAVGTNGYTLVADSSTATGLAWSAPAGGGMPAVYAYQQFVQNPGAGVATKINFELEEFDTNNNFASSRFTPTVAGYYLAYVKMPYDAAPTGNTALYLNLYKNGSTYASLWQYYPINANSWTIQGSALVYMNGSTDYLEVYVYSGAAGATQPGQSTTYFNVIGIRS